MKNKNKKAWSFFRNFLMKICPPWKFNFREISVNYFIHYSIRKFEQTIESIQLFCSFSIVNCPPAPLIDYYIFHILWLLNVNLAYSFISSTTKPGLIDCKLLYYFSSLNKFLYYFRSYKKKHPKIRKEKSFSFSAKTFTNMFVLG